MTKNYDIIIPTKDSANHLKIIAQFYQDKNLSPLFIVDQRTTDNTREIIKDFQFNFLEFLPRGNFPEAGMIEFGAQNCSNNWILRLDDDEIPSQALLDWIETRGIHSRNQGWFLPRRELYRNKERIVFSRSPGKYPIPAHPDKLHPMARLFHKDRVIYREKVHTTGFEDFILYSFAPQQAFFIHLNCLVHSQEKRLAKLEEYEFIDPGVSWQLADEYLPELFEESLHNASYEDLDEFEGILNQFLKSAYNGEIIFLDFNKRELIKKRVFDRINIIKLEQESVERINCDADNIAWLDHYPRSFRWTLAKLLCTIGTKKSKQYGITLWDYLNFYENKM